MKRVALITDGWKRELVYAWVDGILSRIRKSGEKVCLYQYNCFGNWSKDEKHNQGEYNIFNLPNLNSFDGIVVDFNNTIIQDIRSELIDKLRHCCVPVISICYDVDDFYYAGIDNRQAISDMMEHLYRVHHCNRFIFAGGPADNYENRVRAEAYLEKIREFGLDAEKNPVLYGDYVFESGREHFRNVLEKKWDMPDVFLCANDNIAAGLCEEAQKAGYKVPQDFKVTGFDNLDKAAFFQPQITTVEHVREKIGEECMDVLLRIWHGEKPGKYNFVSTKCIYTESCGCENSGLVDYRKYMKQQIINGVTASDVDEMLLKLGGNLAKSNSFQEMFQYSAEFFSKLDCDGFYVVVDKKLYDAELDTTFQISGYDWNDLTLGYFYERGEHPNVDDLRSLYRYMDENGATNTYTFTPLHFKEQTVGFTILKNGRFLYDNSYLLCDIHDTLIRGMENLFKQFQLENANRRMREIYDRDQLTGIYNRIAYSEKIEPAFAEYCSNRVPCAVAFIDADRFKQINDTLGHDYGDRVLKKIAEVLKKNCPEDGYVCRFGGDEFIVFFPGATEEAITAFHDKVMEELEGASISISMGTVLTVPGENKKLDDYLIMADKQMYEKKVAKKEEQGK